MDNSVSDDVNVTDHMRVRIGFALWLPWGQLLMDVLETCVRPKRSELGAVQWATDYGPGVGILLTDHAVARDALPLVVIDAASRS